MKQSAMRLWRTFRFPLMVTFAYLPFPLIVLSYLVPSVLPFAWLWPLSYILLDALGTKIKGKWRALYCFGASIGILALTLLMAVIASDLRLFALPVLYIVLLMICFTLTPADRNEQINPAWYITGIAVHLIAQAVLASAKILNNSVLNTAKPWIFLSFFLFIAICLVSLNQRNLSIASQGRQATSRAMQRKNLLLTLGFFGITLVITMLPKVVSSVTSIFKAFFQFIWGLFQKDFEQTVDSGETVLILGNSVFEFDGEKPALSQWLNTVITIVGLLIVAVVLFFLIRFLIRKFIVFLKRITEVIQQYIHVVSEDYVDEITDTRENNDAARNKANKAKRMPAVDTRKLTPNQQIRYRYGQLMRKHPEWDSGSTARENLNHNAASVYERVRYSQYTANEEESRSFTAETKKV